MDAYYISRASQSRISPTPPSSSEPIFYFFKSAVELTPLPPLHTTSNLPEHSPCPRTTHASLNQPPESSPPPTPRVLFALGHPTAHCMRCRPQRSKRGGHEPAWIGPFERSEEQKRRWEENVYGEGVIVLDIASKFSIYFISKCRGYRTEVFDISYIKMSDFFVYIESNAFCPPSPGIVSSLLRGTIVNRTCGTHKNLYIHKFLPTIFGPVNYGPPY